MVPGFSLIQFLNTSKRKSLKITLFNNNNNNNNNNNRKFIDMEVSCP